MAHQDEQHQRRTQKWIQTSITSILKERVLTWKTIRYWMVFVVGILCFLNFILVLFSGASIHIGTVSLFTIGVSFVLFGYLKIFKKVRVIKNRPLSRMITISFVLLLCSFVTVEALIWTNAKDESNVQVDFVVLLGAGLQGEKISETFMNRIDKCADYLKENPGTKVVVSGGQGIGETITEAEAMSRYLIEIGITKDRIYQEDKATSTYENLTFSKAILDEHFGQKEYTILIATNDFHLFRAKMLAKRLGLVAYGMPAKTWWGTFTSNCIREYFAVIKSFFLDQRSRK